MIEKTSAIKREILKSLIERYGPKGKRILISKVKENSIYRGNADDEEIYKQLEKFAKFHNLILDFSSTILEETIIPETKPKNTDENVYFISILKKEHDLLSKKLLYLNKLISSYES